MIQFDSLCNQEEKNNFDFAGKMVEVEMSDEEESHPKEHENIEQENINDGNLWVNMNESRNDNQLNSINCKIWWFCPSFSWPTKIFVNKDGVVENYLLHS